VNRFFRSALFPLVVIVLLVYLASQTLMPRGDSSEKMTYSQLIQATKNGDVSEVTFTPNRQSITAVLDSGQKVKVNYPSPQSQAQFQNVLEEHNVKFDSKGIGTSAWWALLTGFLPFLLLIGFWIFLMNQMQGGGSKVMSFGKSRAKRMSPDSPKVTYKDVAGADEAVEELQEIKEFLENPKKFQALGARIPKGVLLYGPPGTGKTLLARATAGEAGVPFFSISGSDFVEMFVGVGASRVRDLFEQAKQASPCIIFIDEIDAVGRHRGAGLGGGHDEREQTLNQLLVEMDGFELKDNIILIAATNRPDILDPALLRPGRFDRQIVVDRPDRKGRQQILEVHAKGKPLAKEIDLDVLAAATPGFTGADLANVINEAALLAARRGEKTIGQLELEEGIMRVIAGPEKKSRLFSEKERKITAYHEMGHALVGYYLEGTDEVHKISIVSRGQALGYTISLPSEDRYLTTKGTLMDQMAMTLGGRAAEELVFNEVTTGAANDIERITSTAKQMIMRFGMSEKLGPRVLGRNHDMPFLGREMGAEPDYSEEIAKEIDDEIRRVIEEAHDKATNVLRDHMDELHLLSAILIERETIDKIQFERLLQGEPEESVFADETPPPTAEPEPEPEKKPQLKPSPRPLPGAAMQPPPDPAASEFGVWLGSGTWRCQTPPSHQERGERRHRADGFDREPLHACEVGDREHAPRQPEGAHPDARDPHGTSPGVARLVPCRSGELARPADELPDDDERHRDPRGAGVEGRIVDQEQRDVRAGERRERRAEQDRHDYGGPGQRGSDEAEADHCADSVGARNHGEPERRPQRHRDSGGTGA
jgi:cell division protease FtsH